MLLAVIRKEITELRRDRRFGIVAVLIALLALISIAFSVLSHTNAVSDRAAAVEADHSIWEDQGEVNPHTAAHFGQYAFKPPATLGLFDPGYSPYLGQAVWIEAHFQNPAEARPAEFAATLQRFGDLSPAWIVQTLLPLFVILAGFSILAAERERGNLRLQLVQGASAFRLVTAKTLSLFLLSSLLLAALLLIGLLSAILTGTADSDLLLRWSVLLGVYLTYIAIWCVLVVSVSALAFSSRQSLVVLLGIWVLMAVLAPRMAAEHAVSKHPTTTAGAFWESVAVALDKGLDGNQSREDRAQALLQETLQRHGVETVEDLPFDYDGYALQASEEYGDKVYDKFYSQIAKQEQAQVNHQLWYAGISPLMAVRALSMGAAGSDLAHQQQFLQAAEMQRREIQRILNGEQIRTGRGQYFANRTSADFWKTVPTFQYQQPSFTTLAGNYERAAFILGLWLVLSGCLFFIAAGKVQRQP